jgi:hypothetical protein
MQLVFLISAFLAFGKHIKHKTCTTNLFLAANLSSAKSIPPASKTNELGNENSAEVKI